MTPVAPEEIAAAIDGEDGYSLDLHLGADELACVRRHIEAQWLAVLARHLPQDRVAEFARRGMAHYHELAATIDHANLWPKAARILPPVAVAELRTLPFCATLTAAFGAFEISDEDEVGHEEIYWRLVRPQEPTDMGPLHADRWFWDLGHGTTPPARRRVKLWVAVESEPGRNGLRLVAGSHHKEWRYHGVPKDGKLKPQLDEDETTLGAILLPTAPGDAVVFHDSLLHGGAPNQGSTTRVSFEMTLFVKNHRSHESHRSHELHGTYGTHGTHGS